MPVINVWIVSVCPLAGYGKPDACGPPITYLVASTPYLAAYYRMLRLARAAKLRQLDSSIVGIDYLLGFNPEKGPICHPLTSYGLIAPTLFGGSRPIPSYLAF